MMAVSGGKLQQSLFLQMTWDANTWFKFQAGDPYTVNTPIPKNMIFC